MYHDSWLGPGRMPKYVDHEQRRRELAEAVVRIASSRGLQAVSMREVAAEAGVSLRLVQYYFHTKEELLIGTLRHLGDQLAARVQHKVAAVATTPTPGRVLYGTLAAILPTDDQSRQIMMAYTAFYNYTLTDPGLATDGLRYADAMVNFLAEKIEQAQTTGEIRPDLHPHQTAAALFALTNGLSLGVLVGQHDGDTALAILNQQLDDLLTPDRE
jgi:AcrR family transcriptional regulator